MCVAAFGFIYYLNKNKRYASPIKSNEGLSKLVSFVLPAIILSTVYFSFFLEIEHYFQTLYTDSQIKLENYQYYSNYDILRFKTIWLLIYSMAFVSMLSFINIKKIKNRTLGFINLGLNGLVVLLFLFVGLYSLSELRDHYLTQNLAEYYHIGVFNVMIRYISYVFLGMTLWVSYKYTKASFMNIDNTINFSILFHITLLWILSSELINIMDLYGSTQSYKLGLSILWGVIFVIFNCIRHLEKTKTFAHCRYCFIFNHFNKTVLLRYCPFRNTFKNHCICFFRYFTFNHFIFIQ